MRFRLLPLGLTFGVVWSAAVGGMGLVAMATAEYGHGFVDLVANVYPWYGASIPGAAIGAGWAFCDGFGCGLIMWLALNWSVAKGGE